MRKFWKLGLIVGVVAFMAGCSNLWDYVPPPRVDNAPVSSDGASGGGGGGGGGKPSGGGGGSGPTRNVLTFYINDGSGEAKEVKVTVSGNTATITQIKDAFSRLPSSSTLPPGFTIGYWYESDSKTVAGVSSYSNGGVFVIGYKADPSGDKNGYTVSFAKDSATGNSTDGQREFVTTPTTDGDKTLADILAGAGLTGPAYNPPVPTDWTFRGWAKPDDTNTKINPQTDTNTYSSDTNFVAVYEVPYKIYVGGVSYTVQVPVTGPNKGATWDQIKDAALADTSIPDAAKNEIQNNNTWGAKKPSDTDPSGFGKDEQFPANTDFSETIQFKYTIYDINGNKVVDVDFGLLPSGTVKTLDDIIAEAKSKYGSAVDFGKGRGGNENVEIKNWSASGTVAPGTTIKPISKELTYKLTYKPTSGTYGEHDIKVTVPADKDGATLKEIFVAAGIPSGNVADVAKSDKPSDITADLASGWKVNDSKNEKIISSSRINDGSGSAAGTFPAGTTIKPNWVTNAEASLGSSDRTLTNLNDLGPKKGDGVNIDGEIIKKELIGQYIKDNGNDGTKILGYIYKVDTDNQTVKVVAKEKVQDKMSWSRQKGSYVYYDNDFGGKRKTLRSHLTKNVDSGFDAWNKVLFWNPDAILGNYKALMYALCYPKIPSDFNYDINTDDKSNNSTITNVVDGDGWDKKWFMPTLIELQLIYEARDELLNWTEARHSEKGIGTTGIEDSGEFWSVIVDADTATSAYYIDFDKNNFVDGKPKVESIDKASNAFNVLPVAEFRYENP